MFPIHACLMCSRRHPVDFFYSAASKGLGAQFKCYADTLADEPLLFHFLADSNDPVCTNLSNNTKKYIEKSGCKELLLPDDTLQEFKDLIK